MPFAARTLNTWPDGSIQWSLLDFAVDLDSSGARVVASDTEAAGGAPLPPHPVAVREEPGRLIVSNGLTELVFPTRWSLRCP